jgi:transcriptional regulator of acetoin/glycerol metabolism
MQASSWESYVTSVSAQPPHSVAESTADPLADELARAAAPVLKRTEDALVDTTSWLALADSSATVIYEWASSSQLKRELVRADVESGTMLAEPLVGINGVGTALARGAATLVRGAEHANERWRSLACAASPIVHPLTRQLMGVVNITCLVEDQNSHLKITLNSLVDGIQNELASRSRSRHQRLLEAHLRVVRRAAGPVATLDAYTMIVEDSFGAVPLDRESLWEVVRAAGPMATEVLLPSGQRIQMVPVVPGRTGVGCSLIFGRTLALPGEGRGDVGSRRERLGPLELAEFDVITDALERNDGNKVQTASYLQISRGTLYERLRRYGIS